MSENNSSQINWSRCGKCKKHISKCTCEQFPEFPTYFPDTPTEKAVEPNRFEVYERYNYSKNSKSMLGELRKKEEIQPFLDKIGYARNGVVIEEWFDNKTVNSLQQRIETLKKEVKHLKDNIVDGNYEELTEERDRLKAKCVEQCADIIYLKELDKVLKQYGLTAYNAKQICDLKAKLDEANKHLDEVHHCNCDFLDSIKNKGESDVEPS